MEVQNWIALGIALVGFVGAIARISYVVGTKIDRLTANVERLLDAHEKHGERMDKIEDRVLSVEKLCIAQHG